MSTGEATLKGIATLDIHICDQRRSYKVTFATEAQALSYLESHSSNHAFSELEGGSIPATWEKLYDFLYPTCEHGLSASLCAGYGHYPFDDDEKAAGFFN